MDHLSNWIEIPAKDLARAQAFYEKVLGVELVNLELGGMRYAMFPAKNLYNTGALVQGEGYEPSSTGPLVYLDATGRIDELLEKVSIAGGKVVMPKTFLSDQAGNVAIFIDCEGNRVGLQATEASAQPVKVTDEAMQQLLGSATQGLAFVIRRGPAFDDPASVPLQWEHARNMFTLLKSGKLRAVSAFMDGQDVLGLGLLTTNDRALAMEILRSDPGVRAGRLKAELLVDVTFARDSARF
ncbi:MAG TPA: VOC family protein [Polyangiaceae bacterium]|jgi:hypothetical protein|nr:VOC family protein [Polyangiaceae bacterium]